MSAAKAWDAASLLTCPRFRGREPGRAADRCPEGVLRAWSVLSVVRARQRWLEMPQLSPKRPPAALESVVTEAGGVGEAGVACGEEGGGPELVLPGPGCCFRSGCEGDGGSLLPNLDGTSYFCQSQPLPPESSYVFRRENVL